MKKLLIALIAIMAVTLSSCGSIKEKAINTVVDVLFESYECELDKKS